MTEHPDIDVGKSTNPKDFITQMFNEILVDVVDVTPKRHHLERILNKCAIKEDQ